ncbi:tyrosine-protein phosphatase [Emticicia sp.]|uniref:tyrosine-protein phosphatase n=1 Tax=Emticicia sp. TaxID=1930953 RepID=UPI0037533E69
MWNIFNKIQKKTIFTFLKTDMHSHLLPNVDDGVHNEETSFNFIKNLIELGYKKLILTPHIYSELYPNKKDDLIRKFNVLKDNIEKNKIPIQIELAAEYYIDKRFKELIQDNELLTFGDKFILVETSFVGLPLNFEETLFELITLGYRPVLAHPERYNYFLKNLKYFRHLHERGIFLQINLLSLVGYYGSESYKIAEYLLKERIVSFIGTDLHNERHLEQIKKINFSNSFLKLLENQPLLNNQI